MATEIPFALSEFLSAIDDLVDKDSKEVVYVSGGVAVQIGYGGREDTKDFDVVVRGQSALEALLPEAGKGSPLHRKTGYFLDLVPPIFPLAPGYRGRAIPSGIALTHLDVRLLEVHDLVVTKLLRMHAKDRRDVETLARHPSFSAALLVERYRAAREELKMYWPDKIGKADANMNAVLVETLGEPAIPLWGDEE